MKNAITKPKKQNAQQPNRMKALTSIVLAFIIGVFGGLIILALSSTNAFAKPQDRVMRSGEVGVFYTVEDAIMCGRFTDWTDMLAALNAQSTDLVYHYLTKPNSLCISAKGDVEIIVTESNDRWAEGKFKTSTGDYLTIWTHHVFLRKKGA